MSQWHRLAVRSGGQLNRRRSRSRSSDVDGPAVSIRSHADSELVELQKQRLRRQIENEQRIADAKLAALTNQAATPTAVGATAAAAPIPSAQTQGEIPPLVRNIMKTLADVPLSQIMAIQAHEFLPENLHKLRRSYDRSLDEVESTMELAPNGSFVVKKAKGKMKDFGTDERIWPEGFLAYVEIIGYLFQEHGATTLAIMRFHNKIVELSRVYQWLSVLNLAINYHNVICSDSVLVIDAWLHIPSTSSTRTATPVRYDALRTTSGAPAAAVTATAAATTPPTATQAAGSSPMPTRPTTTRCSATASTLRAATFRRASVATSVLSVATAPTGPVPAQGSSFQPLRRLTKSRRQAALSRCGYHRTRPILHRLLLD